jgi:hypothetical protein
VRSFKGLASLSVNEQIWACLFFFFSSLGLVVANHLFEFHNNPEYNSLAIASKKDCLIVFPVAIITWVSKEFICS